MTQRQRLANCAPNTLLAADVGDQSFYVTLDVSSAADYNKLRTKKKKPDSPQPKLPQSTGSNAPTSPVALDNAAPSEPPETLIQVTPALIDIDGAPSQAEEEASHSESETRIQILDLHTLNPLISYQNRLYSCGWTSTLGTDLLLTAPAPEFSHQVLREQPNVSVLAASRIKLMGRPARIASRLSANEVSQRSTPAPDSSIASANAASQEKATQVKIPLGATPSRARQNQANFLERLIAIKAKKGEKDSVTVHAQKVNQGTGWRSQRKASEAIEDEEGETTPKQSRSERSRGGRPRGSRRTGGARTAKGGLFRDYRPQLWDTAGADIRAGPSSTPQSWDQLESGASDGRQTPTITTAPASPLPTDQPAQPANRSTGSLSASASANASPTTSSRPAHPTNSEEISSVGQASPSPSLALALGQQPAIVVEQSAVSPGVLDPEILQQKQTEAVIAGQSTTARDAATGPMESYGMAAAGDVEMEDV